MKNTGLFIHFLSKVHEWVLYQHVNVNYITYCERVFLRRINIIRSSWSHFVGNSITNKKSMSFSWRIKKNRATSKKTKYPNIVTRSNNAISTIECLSGLHFVLHNFYHKILKSQFSFRKNSLWSISTGFTKR